MPPHIWLSMEFGSWLRLWVYRHAGGVLCEHAHMYLKKQGWGTVTWGANGCGLSENIHTCIRKKYGFGCLNFGSGRIRVRIRMGFLKNGAVTNMETGSILKYEYEYRIWMNNLLDMDIHIWCEYRYVHWECNFLFFILKLRNSSRSMDGLFC